MSPTLSPPHPEATSDCFLARGEKAMSSIRSKQIHVYNRLIQLSEGAAFTAIHSRHPVGRTGVLRARGCLGHYVVEHFKVEAVHGPNVLEYLVHGVASVIM